MKCPNCHAELSENAKFCTKCGTKITVQTAAPKPEAAAANVCTNCGAALKPGAKFCNKCGTKCGDTTGQTSVKMTPVGAVPTPEPELDERTIFIFEEPKQATYEQPVQPQPTQAIYQQPIQPQTAQTYQQPVQPQAAQTYRQPVQQTTPQQSAYWQPVPGGAAQNTGKKKDKKKKSGGSVVLTIVIVLLLVVILGLGGWLLWQQFSGSTAGSGEKTTASESKEGAEGAEETASGDPELLDELDDELDALCDSVATADSKEVAGDGVDLIEKYEEIADANGLEAEASEKIQTVLDAIIPSAVSYCETIENQHLGSSGYTEITGTIEPITEKVAALTEKGYEVDAADAIEYSDGLVGRMREYYINCINDITGRDQWSRDEAWAYAEQAYSIQRDGKLVLFDESEKDDPLTLRYEYCLARITLKRCENGIADGSMTSEGAFNEMVAILDQTDYNLLVLQGAIDYGSAAGLDVSAYQNAYNAIADQLKNGQGLTIVHTGENSGSTVDLQKFWYFNDLDGDTAYMVDVHNGTTQATRTWIRENIPAYFE